MTDHSADTPPVHQRDEAFNSEYSMITLDNMYSTVYENTRQRRDNESTRPRVAEQASRTTTQGQSPAIATKAEKVPKKKRLEDESTGCKLFTCVFITIAVVATITLICLAILFAEVLKLKVQTSSTSQPSPQQAADVANDFSSIMLQLKKLNDTISSIKGLMQTENFRLEDQLNNSASSLERSLDIAVNNFHQQLSETNAAFGNHIQQLNSSIETIKIGQENTQSLNSSIQMALMESRQAEKLLTTTLVQSLALPVSCSSLRNLSPTSPNGYYWVRSSNGSAVRVYCDMTRSCGGVTGGWMRVAELYMTNSSHQCPSELSEHTKENRRTCRIAADSAGCSPAITYSTISDYSKVCGKIIAFPKVSDTTDGFYGIGRDRRLSENYVDGVSLTDTNFSQHIWTFAAVGSGCTCGNPPAFVGMDYFCDSDTPLWQRRCINNPPWFYNQLQSTNGIKMRVCRDEQRGNEDIEIQVIEIYVQ